MNYISGEKKISDSNKNYNDDGEMVPAEAHIGLLAEQFLDPSFQSHRVDHQTTLPCNFCPMRPTHKVTSRNRME